VMFPALARVSPIRISRARNSCFSPIAGKNSEVFHGCVVNDSERSGSSGHAGKPVMDFGPIAKEKEGG